MQTEGRSNDPQDTADSITTNGQHDSSITIPTSENQSQTPTIEKSSTTTDTTNTAKSAKPSTTSQQKPYKKRNRTPASCSVCRSRKAKCDRARPTCGSCLKKSIAHLCYYESPNGPYQHHHNYYPPNQYNEYHNYQPQHPQQQQQQQPPPPQPFAPALQQQGINPSPHLHPHPHPHPHPPPPSSSTPSAHGGGLPLPIMNKQGSFQTSVPPAPFHLQHNELGTNTNNTITDQNGVIMQHPHLPPQMYNQVPQSPFSSDPANHLTPMPYLQYSQQGHYPHSQRSPSALFPPSSAGSPNFQSLPPPPPPLPLPPPALSQQQQQQQSQQQQQQKNGPGSGGNNNNSNKNNNRMSSTPSLPMPTPPLHGNGTNGGNTLFDARPNFVSPGKTPNSAELKSASHHTSLSGLPLPQPPSGPINTKENKSDKVDLDLNQPTKPGLHDHDPSPRSFSKFTDGQSPGGKYLSQQPSPLGPGFNHASPPIARLKSLASESYISPNSNSYNSKPKQSVSSPLGYSFEKTQPNSIQSQVSQVSQASPGSDHSAGTAPSFSTNALVSIPLGPNSSLQVSPDDRINVFANASNALGVEGLTIQLQGALSYVGLTKCDPFITILRNFTLHLFRNGEMASFIANDSTKKRRLSNESSTRSSRHGGSTSVGTTSMKRPKLDPLGSPNSERKLGENDTGGDTASTATAAATATAMGVSRSADSINVENGNFTTSFSNNNSNSNNSNGSKSRSQPMSSFDLASPLNSYSPSVPGNLAATTVQAVNNKNNNVSYIPSMEKFYTGRQGKKSYFALVERVIVDLLPTQINSFHLFCRFFKYSHQFIPIFDENKLIVELNQIFKHFPTFSKEKWSNLNIRNDHDLRTLGVFLLMTRLGYMSLIHNDNVYNDYTEDELSMIADMEHITSSEFTRAINMCIGDALTAAKSSFKLVQLLALYYFYKENSNEDGHGICGADSQTLLGITMRHALSIGLNRDPTSYMGHDSISKNTALIKTWRYLWHYLVCTDAVSSLHNGTNLNLMNLDMSDVQAPYESKDQSGQLNEFLKKYIQICKVYRQLCNKINNVNEKPRIVDILADTNYLEKMFFEFFGKDFFKSVICKPANVRNDSSSDWEIGSREHEENYLKVMKYCLFIQLRTNLSGMYYMIAIHYENEYNESRTPSMNAGIELFKIYIKSVVQLVYIMSYVLDNSVDIFGKNYDYVLTSSNERHMIRTHSFLTSFFVRLLHQKKDLSFKVFKEPSYIPRLEVIDTLFTIVLIEAELFVGNFKKLSRTYINSYRLYIMTYIILRQCVENPEVFFEKAVNDQQFFHQGTNMIEFFSIAELQHLCRLCGEFRTAKEEQRKLKNERLRAKGIHVDDDDDDDKNNNNNNNNNDDEYGNKFDTFSMDQYNDLDLPTFRDDDLLLGRPSPGGSSTNPMSFFDDKKIFSNLNNLNDDALDPITCTDDLIRLFNIYGDFDQELFQASSS